MAGHRPAYRLEGFRRQERALCPSAETGGEDAMSGGPTLNPLTGTPAADRRTLDMLVSDHLPRQRVDRGAVVGSPARPRRCVLTLSVILRYFLKVPTDWQDEVAVFLLVGVHLHVRCLCPVPARPCRHRGAGQLLLPKAPIAVRRILVDCVSFAFCGFFSWKSWAMLHEALVGGHDHVVDWAPPLWIPYGLMAVGMSLI